MNLHKLDALEDKSLQRAQKVVIKATIKYAKILIEFLLYCLKLGSTDMDTRHGHCMDMWDGSFQNN